MKLYLLIFSGLLFTGCHQKKTDLLAPSQLDFISLLPAESQLITYIDVAGIRETKFKTEVIEEALGLGWGWIKEMEKETGPGLREGISRICTGSSLGGYSAVIISFSAAVKAENYFKRNKKFLVKNIEGNKIYKTDNYPDLNFYFPSDSLLFVSGSEDYLLSLNKEVKKPLTKNKLIYDLVKNAENANHYWMVTNQPSYASLFLKKMFNIDENTQVREIVKSLDNIRLGITFRDEAEVKSVLGCRSTRNAFLLSSALRGAIALNLFTEKNNVLGEILGKADLERKNNDISLAVCLGDEEIKKVNTQIDLNWNNFRN